ncbi:MAG TPA: response regulator [Gaiellaceae bacterium]|nr:response regulator [Gaiellaceae bacterium]
MAGSARAWMGDDEGPDVESHLAPSVAPVPSNGTPQAAEQAPPRVLIVEDDVSMSFLCRFNLELEGFAVTTATTGAEGLSLAERDAYDLVLLDVMLPDLGGHELAARIGDTPVVFMSARGSADDLARGRAAGAIDYIVKPFDPVTLPERLRRNLDELGRSGPDGVWRLRHGSPPA